MMDDRQLLEAAAKAAGYDYRPQNGAIVVDGIPGNWNPLTDDGDALRLAVKLKLIVETEASYVDWGDKSPASMVVTKDDQCVGERHVNSDPYAATRRAIVRAAAEIGKAK